MNLEFLWTYESMYYCIYVLRFIDGAVFCYCFGSQLTSSTLFTSHLVQKRVWRLEKACFSEDIPSHASQKLTSFSMTSILTEIPQSVDIQFKQSSKIHIMCFKRALLRFFCLVVYKIQWAQVRKYANTWIHKNIKT